MSFYLEYDAFVFMKMLDCLTAVTVVAVCAAVVALAVGAAINKLEGSAATIATLGLLIIVHGVIIGWRDVTRGAQSFFGVPRVTDLVTAAAFCVVALFLARLYRDSSSGLRLRAGRENAIAVNFATIQHGLLKAQIVAHRGYQPTGAAE